MTKKKLCILIVSTLIILAAAIVVAAVVAQNHAIELVSHKIQNKIDALHWHVDIEKQSWLPTAPCVKSLTLTNEKNAKVTLSHICIDEGAMTLLDDARNLSISCDSIEADLDWDAFEDLKQYKSSEESGNAINKIGSAPLFVQIEVKNTHIGIGHSGQRIEFKSSNDYYKIDNKNVWADVTLHPSIDLKKFPVAFRNLPVFRVVAMADIKQKEARLLVQSTPAIEIAYAADDKVVEASLHALNVIADSSGASVELDGVCVQSDDIEIFSDACVDGIQADFNDIRPSRKTLEIIRVNHPVLTIDVPRLLNSKSVTENPMLSGLVGYWKQDAGKILGEAPNKSVKKADVKKNAPVAQKNPIPEKTLNAIRDAFNKVQQKVLALPVVDIRDGHVDIVHDDVRFAFDAISFNTAELFKDSQKFQLDFNVRQANAQFVIQYSGDSPYPVIDLKIDNLDSADFLRLINMPIPQNNDGRVSLNLGFSMDDSEIHLAGNIAFADFALYHPKISPNLIHDIQASANVDVHYIFKQDLLKIEPIALSSGPLTLNGYVNILNVRSNPTIEFQLGTKDFPCKDIPKAIPAGLLPTITDLEIAGTAVSPTITGKIPWNYPLTSTLRETGFEGNCYPVSVAPHMPEILNDDHYTFTTDYTYFTDAITVGPGTSGFVDLEDIPPYVKAAMYLTEDKRMFDNPPLRIAFIERALRLNLNQRRYVYGGSTIAQQLTKNLFLNRNKNLARKLEEAFVSWRLVSVVPRTRILELYLNMIEFGPDVYGLKKAAHFYFNKDVKDLTPLEGAYLASLKVSPSKGGRYYKQGFAASGRWWNKRLRYIMRVLAENGYISGIDVLSAYDWTPKFYYPPASETGDYRNIWLSKYGNYLREKAVAAKNK